MVPGAWGSPGHSASTSTLAARRHVWVVLRWRLRGRRSVNTPAHRCRSDIPSGGRCLTGPWTVTRSSLRVLRRVAAFCRPLRFVLLVVSFPRSRSPAVGALGVVLVVAGVVLWFWLPTPLRIQVVHHMPRHICVCARPNCSTPPRIVLVVCHPPLHAATCLRPNYSIFARGARGHCVHPHGPAGVVCTSAGRACSFGLPWHPVATGLAGQATPRVVTASHSRAPVSSAAPCLPASYAVLAARVLLNNSASPGGWEGVGGGG